MRRLIGTRDLRTLIVGLTVCVSLILVARGLPLWRKWRDDVRGRVIASSAALEQATTTLAARKHIARALERTAARMNGADSLLMSGATAEDGAAQLASMVGAAADGAHMRLSALQLRADTNPNTQLSKASVRLSGIADVAGLTSILHELESGAPLLVVRELSVSQSDALAPDDRAEQLRIELTVEGLTRLPAATSRTAARTRP